MTSLPLSFSSERYAFLRIQKGRGTPHHDFTHPSFTQAPRPLQRNCVCSETGVATVASGRFAPRFLQRSFPSSQTGLLLVRGEPREKEETCLAQIPSLILAHRFLCVDGAGLACDPEQSRASGEDSSRIRTKGRDVQRIFTATSSATLMCEQLPEDCRLGDAENLPVVGRHH